MFFPGGLTRCVLYNCIFLLLYQTNMFTEYPLLITIVNPNTRRANVNTPVLILTRLLDKAKLLFFEIISLSAWDKIKSVNLMLTLETLLHF